MSGKRVTLSAFAARQTRPAPKPASGSSETSTFDIPARETHLESRHSKDQSLESTGTPNISIKRKRKRSRGPAQAPTQEALHPVPTQERSPVPELPSEPHETYRPSVDSSSLRATVTLAEKSDSDSSVGSNSDYETGVAVKIPTQQLSTLSKHTKFENGKSQSLQVTLYDHDVLTLVGQYDIWVRKGTVSVLGALMHANSKLHRVYAPSSHSLPSIRHMRSPFGPEKQEAEITIYSCRSALRLLERLNPKFTKLWNRDHDGSGRSFTILRKSDEDFYQRPLSIFEPSADWQTLTVNLTSRESNTPLSILICGPKGAGKSSYGRFLANSFLSKKAATTGFLLLDLDPGQPEYSAPGEVSLIHVRSYNLGPPFTHPLIQDQSENSLIRSHHIGMASPKDDTHHYLECAKDLVRTYEKTYRGLGYPLIVNSCGWVQGLGLEFLESFIQSTKLTDVMYMSLSGPGDAVEKLRRSTDKTGGTLHLLSSQKTEYVTRTATDLRSMQTMSYFHTAEQETAMHRWNPVPMYIHPTQVLKFRGNQQDIIGIMMLGDERRPDSIRPVINGCVLALVAIEDELTMPPTALQKQKLQDSTESAANEEGTETLDEDAEQEQGEGGESAEEQEQGGEHPDDEWYHNQARKEVEDMGIAFINMREGPRPPPILRGKHELPYLFYGNGANIPLDPTKSRTIGHVLIRDIGGSKDTAVAGDRDDLKILTPIPSSTIEALKASTTPLVLVRGPLEVPGWCYTEEYHEAMASQRDVKRWKRCRERNGIPLEWEGEDNDLDWQVHFDVEDFVERTPWVGLAKRGDNGGKSKGGRAWKVRRNMTTNDGRRPAK